MACLKALRGMSMELKSSMIAGYLPRHGRACPGLVFLFRKARRGCPAQGRA
jgi:hypothetical protein